MNRIVTCICAVLLCMFTAYAIPQQLNYQGYLTRTDGSPLDTTVAMAFRIYGMASGGSMLWMETHPVVVVTDGLFHVSLGSVTPLSDLFSANRWLEIQVGGDLEMTPRQQIVSVAHSYRVGTVDGASGGTISGDVSVGGMVSIAGDVIAHGKANIGLSNSNPGLYAFVAGYTDTAAGNYSTVSGGYYNKAMGGYSTVGGGYYNDATGYRATVGGGANNEALGNYATVGGGYSNEADTLYATVSGGHNNDALGNYATVSGGHNNDALGNYATVGGGEYNRARGPFSVVAGGGGGTGAADSNSAMGECSAIGGGARNTATHLHATVGGGYWNTAGGSSATVGGGADNEALGGYTTVGGGLGNDASGFVATVGGGLYNQATDEGATVGGGENNAASGHAAVVAGGYVNTASGDSAAVGGGSHNSAQGNASTVGGGSENNALAHYAAVGGGYHNSVAGSASVVSGGSWNSTGASNATVPGGYRNYADGTRSFAAGDSATTTGANSFVLGTRIVCNSDSAFVWSDGTGPVLGIGSSRTFSVKATNGTRIWTNSDLTAGVRVNAGGNAWIAVSDSTKKRNIRGLDTQDILSRFSSLPLKRWEYQSEESGVEHIGPMAQDFWNAFHLGNEPLGISTIDADGVLFAAIQELAKQNDELRTAVRGYQDQLNTLLARVQTLEANNKQTSK